MAGLESSRAEGALSSEAGPERDGDARDGDSPWLHLRPWACIFLHLLPEALEQLKLPVLSLNVPVVCVKFFFEGLPEKDMFLSGTGAATLGGEEVNEELESAVLADFRAGRRRIISGLGWKIYTPTEPNASSDLGGGDRAELLFA